MNLLGPALLSAVFVGSVYALVAVGYTILFRAGGILNFAQSTLMVFAAFAAATLASQGGIAVIGPLALAVAGTAALSALIYVLFLRRFVGLDPLGLTIMTMGIGIVIQAILDLHWGDSLLAIHLFKVDSSIHIEGVGNASPSQLVTVIVTLAVFGGLGLFFRYTRLGLQLRAASEAPVLATRNGINVARIYSVAWIIAGLVAGIGGILLGATSSVSVSIGDVGLAAFPAAVVGGFGSIGGALLGGLIVGLAEQLTSFYVSPTLASVAAYAVMFLILMVRPAGLLGKSPLVRS